MRSAVVSGSALHFEVKRNDLHECRTVEGGVPDLDEGQALLRVDAFGFTSNNVTYAVFGEAMKYWEFFPAPGGWGRIPVWGFADTVVSTHGDLVEGSRVYGYLPMSTHLVVTPDRVDGRGFVDAAPHRTSLPPAYNSYQHAGVGPASDSEHEAHRMLLWPLFFTSFLLDSYLEDAGFWGAGTIVLSSASSKTAVGTSFLLADRDDIEVVGLTSSGNADFVESLGTYDRVATYDAVGSLPSRKAVYVDLAGNSEVRGAVHHHYGDDLAFSVQVGGTHWDQTRGGAGDLPGPAPSFFFAPDQIRKRARQHGQEDLDAELGAAWTRFVDWTDDWFTVIRGNGPAAVEHVYREQLDGRTDASTGHALSMWA
jgi:Protein of unknown function (DUF2855)